MNTACRGPALFQSLGARRMSLVLAIALGIGGLVTACLWPGLTHAHGAAAKMVPLKKTLEDFGATVRWDAFARVYTITRNSTLVRVKPGSKAVLVNGQSLELDVPVVMRGGRGFMSHDFINQVFQSSLDKTFVVERMPSPLNPLTGAEIKATVDILKASNRYEPGYRFTEITLKAPPKDQVWHFALTGQPVQSARQAAFVILNGKKVIEGTVDLAARSVSSWRPIEGAHGMVLIDDFATVQSAIETSAEYAQALTKRGISDVKKVVARPLRSATSTTRIRCARRSTAESGELPRRGRWQLLGSPDREPGRGGRPGTEESDQYRGRRGDSGADETDALRRP